MKVLFFGDIVGRAGRMAVAKAVPLWREKYSPDCMLANVDNLAHGKAATPKTIEEMLALGFDAFTTGDHAFDNDSNVEVLKNPNLPIVRPLNMPDTTPGVGCRRITVGSRDVLVVHLMGQVFLRDGFSSPFAAIDELLAGEQTKNNIAAIIVDVHAEATSEKVALGWHLDSRVTAVLGTHTHVPTCDERVLPGGTAYVTDVGMCGVRDSVLGVKKELSLTRFLTGEQVRFEPAEVGEVEVAAMLVTFDPATAKATAIERLREFVTIA